MKKPLIHLENALFSQLSTPSAKSALVFPDPVSLTVNAGERWCFTGPRKTELLQILASQHLPLRPLSRTYPFLKSSTWPTSVVQFLDFKGVLPTAHLAARYEFFKDEFDLTTEKFVRGDDIITNRAVNESLMREVFARLKLEGLEERWALGLSNGQMRRARIAKALLNEPKILIFDDPFLGLDPVATTMVSHCLAGLAPNPYVILGLRYQDGLPDWVTHVGFTTASGLACSGPREEMKPVWEAYAAEAEAERKEKLARFTQQPQISVAEKSHVPHLQLDGVSVSYRGQSVLKDLQWTVKKGEKWHLRGDNGTGKSTLLALITADHPQSWSSNISVEGTPRKTGKQSYWDINNPIGFSSPEFHAIIPNHLTTYEFIGTGFHVSNMMRPALTAAQGKRIDSLLDQFDLAGDRDTLTKNLPLSEQKLALFLRAVVKSPELLILDEAFSCMDALRVEQCKAWLKQNYADKTVIAIAHLENELPACDKYIRLLGPGKTEFGSCA